MLNFTDFIVSTFIDFLPNKFLILFDFAYFCFAEKSSLDRSNRQKKDGSKQKKSSSKKSSNPLAKRFDNEDENSQEVPEKTMKFDDLPRDNDGRGEPVESKGKIASGELSRS